MTKPDGSSSRIIAIVTGANGGLGYGICKRLLFQLSLPSVPDSQLQLKPALLYSPLDPRQDSTGFRDFSGVTLVLACRSKARAEAAIKKLWDDLVHELERRRQNGIESRKDFISDLKIEFKQLDLASMASVYRFTKEVKVAYSYITHIFCNAGVGAWGPIDWPAAFLEVAVDPMKGVTDPSFKTQLISPISDDGLGWVWQCNVFGHYCMVKDLFSHLVKSPHLPPSRVVWVSSFLGSPSSLALTLDDLQLTTTLKSYDLSKRQIDLISSQMDRDFVAAGDGKVRCFTCDPAVCATEIFRPQLGIILYQLMMFTFYFVRLVCNSQNHPISLLSGAKSFTHVALAPASALPYPKTSSEKSIATSSIGPSQRLKFRSLADRWGRPYVGEAIIDAKEDDCVRLRDALDGVRRQWESKLSVFP